MDKPDTGTTDANRAENPGTGIANANGNRRAENLGIGTADANGAEDPITGTADIDGDGGAENLCIDTADINGTKDLRIASRHRWSGRP